MGWGNVIVCPKDDLLRSHPSQPSHLWAVPSPGIWAGSAACFWWTGHSGSDAAWLLGLSHQELCAVSALVSWDTGSWQAPFWNPAALLGDARTPEGAHMKVLWLTAPAELFADSQRWLLAICVMWPSSPAEPSEACSLPKPAVSWCPHRRRQVRTAQLSPDDQQNVGEDPTLFSAAKFWGGWSCSLQITSIAGFKVNGFKGSMMWPKNLDSRAGKNWCPALSLSKVNFWP